jgi:hypothetical protein
MSAMNPLTKELSQMLPDTTPSGQSGEDSRTDCPPEADAEHDDPNQEYELNDEIHPEECVCEHQGNPLRESMLRLLKSPAPPREDPNDIQIDPPPAIDPQRIAGIPKLGSLGEGVGLFEDINRNIELLEGLDELTGRAQRLEYLKKANEAKRCEHLKLDGTSCGSPAVRGHQYCYFHGQVYAPPYDLPAIEDQRSLQLALLRLAQQVYTSTLSLPQAKLLLQILQTAGKNLPMEEMP